MKNKQPKNEQKLPHGHWVIYYSSDSDKVWFEANFVNGVQYGYEMNVCLNYRPEKLHIYHAR
jgi:hypothetical protein